MKSNKFFDNIQKTKFDFVKNFPKMALASVCIIFVGLIVWIFAGFNLGLDFTGGSIMKVKFGAVLEQDGVYSEYSGKIQKVFSDNGITLSQIQKENEGEDACITVRFQDKSGYTEAEMNELVSGKITDELTLAFNADGSNTGFSINQSERIGSTASSELLFNALLAILIAAVLLLIYIAIRFQFVSGVATLVGIIHDVLIMCAFVAICRIEVNSAFIAALITVIGYSINNTIIVFDRVRENQKIESVAKDGLANTINVSIKQTLVRSIYTSLTTILSILVLIIIGVESIKIFLLPILIGLIAGTYSSIFIAGPLWELMLRRYNKRKAEEAKYKKLKPTANTTVATDEKSTPVEVEVIEQ